MPGRFSEPPPLCSSTGQDRQRNAQQLNQTSASKIQHAFTEVSLTGAQHLATLPALSKRSEPQTKRSKLRLFVLTCVGVRSWVHVFVSTEKRLCSLCVARRRKGGFLKGSISRARSVRPQHAICECLKAPWLIFVAATIAPHDL